MCWCLLQRVTVVHLLAFLGNTSVFYKRVFLWSLMLIAPFLFTVVSAGTWHLQAKGLVCWETILMLSFLLITGIRMKPVMLVFLFACTVQSTPFGCCVSVQFSHIPWTWTLTQIALSQLHFFLITFNTIASRLQYFFFFFLNNPLKTWADTNLNV